MVPSPKYYEHFLKTKTKCSFFLLFQLLSTAVLFCLVLVFPLSSACDAASLVSGWTHSWCFQYSLRSIHASQQRQAPPVLRSAPSTPSSGQQRDSLENTSRFPGFQVSSPDPAHTSLAFLSLSAFTVVTSSCLILRSE